MAAARSQVVDQGGQWDLRLSFGGEEVGEIVVLRAQLERDGWKVVVPAEIGRQPVETGYPPSAF